MNHSVPNYYFNLFLCFLITSVLFHSALYKEILQIKPKQLKPLVLTYIKQT